MSLPPSLHWFIIYKDGVNKGSYMSANIFFNILNELRKKYKWRGLPSIFIVFFLQRLNYTGALMLDFLSYGIKITLKSHCMT